MATLRITKLKHKILYLVLMIVASLLLSVCQPAKKNKPRVLLIGLDGASWNVMQPLIKEGKLPHIKELMDKGCSGAMRTFFPLQSEVIWTSIATGKTSQKHGISGLLMNDPDTGEYVPVSSNLRKAEAIWSILSENKRKVGIVNYLVTWPAEKVNGVMIAGRKVDIKDITCSAKRLSYPLFTELCSEEELEGLKGLKVSLFSEFKKEENGALCDKSQRIDNFMANFAKRLLRNPEFDFFCLYLMGTDVVSHYFWKYSFPEGFAVPQEEIQKYKDLINNYYIWCDGIIGDVLKAAGDFDLVILCSDHGFQARPEGICNFEKVDYLLEICGLNRIVRWGKEIILENKPADMNLLVKNIRIAGNLSPEEFNSVRQEAKEALREIVVKETGDHLFGDFQDTQHGFLIKVPDLYARPNTGHHIIVRGKEYRITDIFSENLHSGDHSESAVIIVSGKNIYRNREIKSATIYDITPTILYYLGLPVAKDMDGKVLFEAIKKDYLKKNPVQYITTYETEDKIERIEKPIRSPDEESIKEMMRSLGYIN